MVRFATLLVAAAVLVPAPASAAPATGGTQAQAGFTDATAAKCKRADRYGLDLWVSTPRGGGPARVVFAEPCTAPDGLRAATIELARASRV